MITNFKTLKVWQRARVFVKMIYKITKTFLREEQSGLTSQLNISMTDEITQIRMMLIGYQNSLA